MGLILLIDLLNSVLMVSTFLLPFCIIYRSNCTIGDRIILWISPVVLYNVFTGVIIPIFLSHAVTFSSMEIFSIIAFFTTIVWWVFKNKRLQNFMEILLLLHIEALLMSWVLSKVVFSIMRNYVFMVNFAVLLLVMIIQVGIIPGNKKGVALAYQNNVGGILRKVLFAGIGGIYFYQLILPYFLIGESASIIYGGYERGNITQDTLSVFVKILLVLLAISIVVAIITIRYHFLKVGLKEKTLRERELKNYIHTMEMMQTDIQRIHHDYKNLIVALGGYLYDEDEAVDIQGLRSYYQKNILIQKETELKTINLSKLQKLNILEIKGLLAAKLIQASQQSIQIFVEIQENIESIPMDKLDLSRVVGILLDNAIEAAAECEQPEIRIAFIQNDNAVVFIVENSTLAVNIPIAQLHQKAFSTKGRQRGLGLSNVWAILEQYPNIYQETELKNGRFQQRIIFQNEEL